MIEEYPLEYFVPLNGNQFLLGKITLSPMKKGMQDYYHMEIDLVLTESKKIYRHIGIFDCRESKDEAIDLAIQRLSEFVRSKESLK